MLSRQLQQGTRHCCHQNPHLIWKSPPQEAPATCAESRGHRWLCLQGTPNSQVIPSLQGCTEGRAHLTPAKLFGTRPLRWSLDTRLDSLGFGKCWLTAKPQGCVCGQLHALAPDCFCAAATPSKPTWGHLGSFVVLIHIKIKKKK